MKRKCVDIIAAGVLLLIIIGVIIMPFIVNGGFRFELCEDTSWSPADILSYCGTALSIIATAILSFIAVVISSKANDVSNRMLKLEEERMTPYLDILREKSSILECADDNEKLKVKLHIRNLGEHPIQNILLSQVELSKKEIENLYIKEEIQNTIINQFEKIYNEKNSVDYNLTCIAGLREMVVIHSKSKNGEKTEEEEYTPFSENLYFNIDKREVGTPIDLFITMQNISGKVFMQKTTVYIIQRNNDRKYFLTMHSKRIKTIKF